MKGKFGKIGMISLALVIALAGLGVVFAHWTETLTTEANVSTGELKLELTDPDCEDNYPWGDLISCEKDESASSNDSQTFTITIVDAYPGYWGKCTFNIENTGTIPAKICCKPTYTASPPVWAKVDIDDTLSFNGLPVTMYPGDFYGGRYIKVTINEEGNGKNNTVVECEENYSFTFTLTIKAMQWNYAP